MLCCAGHEHLLRTQAGAGQALEQPTTTTQQVGLLRTHCAVCIQVLRDLRGVPVGALTWFGISRLSLIFLGRVDWRRLAQRSALVLQVGRPTDATSVLARLGMLAPGLLPVQCSAHLLRMCVMLLAPCW